MSEGLPFAHFSTADVPPHLQFEAWRNQLSAFESSPENAKAAKSFAATVDMYVLGSTLVFCAKQGSQRYEITPQRAQAKGPNLFLFTFYKCGGYQGYARADTIEGGAGDMQVLDLSQPMISRETSAAITGVVVSHEALREKLGTLDNLHGLDLRRTTGRFLGDYFQLLAGRLPTMSVREASAAAEATVGVIAACVRPTQDRLKSVAEQVSDVLFARAEKAIEQNLQNPQLSPRLLCGNLGVSRRALYRAFEKRSGVHEYILERRLSAVARTIALPGETRTISEVAELYGFGVAETFWRAFKRRFGLTPGEFRARGHILDEAGPSLAMAAVFDSWKAGRFF